MIKYSSSIEIKFRRQKGPINVNFIAIRKICGFWQGLPALFYFHNSRARGESGKIFAETSPMGLLECWSRIWLSFLVVRTNKVCSSLKRVYRSRSAGCCAYPIPDSWLGFPSQPNQALLPFGVGELVADSPGNDKVLTFSLASHGKSLYCHCTHSNRLHRVEIDCMELGNVLYPL